MLQPRLRVVCASVSVKNMGVSMKIGRKARCSAWLTCAALLLSSSLVLCQDINNNNEDTIEATRIKRDSVPENRDLTVLLVNDNKRLGDFNSKIGRYHSIKPVIGLLTSTARTFIQDGVTTEFATQILGTTLDNGRIYAQLLTKSSLVLYNNPSKVDDTVVRPTRVHSAFDGQWNVKQDLGFIDPEKFVLKNTDYIAPSDKMEIVYASKPSGNSFNSWNAPTPEVSFGNQIYDEPTGRRVQPVKEIPRYVQNEALNYLDGPSIENDRKYDIIKPSIINNVNTLHRSSKAYEPVQEIKLDARIKGDTINESSVVKVKPNHDLPTFTIKNEFSPIFYYIDNVESRSSVQQQSQQTKLPKKLFGQNNEPRPKKTFTYAGFADFTTVVGDTVIIFTPNTETNKLNNPGQVNVFPSAKRVEKLASKITFLSADIPVATSTFKPHEVKEPTKITTPRGEDSRSDKALYNDEDSLKKVLYDVDDKLPDVVNVQYNNGFNLNMDVIQPSEPATTTERTKVINNLEVIPIQSYNSQATDPLQSLKPSATVTEEEPVVTESDSDYYTDSDEVITTESSEEVTEMNEEEITTENEAETEITTEGNVDHLSEQSDNKGKDVICTNGIETLSTMTTEYKTLTYLTTYFIPLESTETTTSVKSNVVVESNVGYLTNVVCQSNYNIQPTATVKVEIKATPQSSLEQPELKDVTKKEPENFTELTTTNEELLTTLSEDSNKETTVKVVEELTEKDDETTTSTTTEHSVTSSHSHVEVSVTTEESPVVSTEEENKSHEQIDSNENEIDLIYKTLYTTYTYFTTFFGDQTSSVASHKSVVTNIVTSTIDLSKMDPSLLDVFDEDEIAPTSVGIGRPTESFAINSIIDLVKNKDVIESVENADIYSSQTPTPSLGDDIAASIKPDAVKTYFTTYTFFTTIFVGNDANICSRSEVYTNYVGPDELIPTKSSPLGEENTKAQFDFRNCRQVKNIQEATTESPITTINDNKLESSDASSPQPTPVEVDMLFSVESNPLESENSFVTDVKSSSSKGEKQLLENNNVLEDQISSESNIEEIMPSPTLLLQTSYTTFTYFTTMYIGKDSSKVKSRLETITNVVTETITPKKEVDNEENNLPITYYTTFTYWTTLCKDDSTTITSREEIVSNVVTPSVQSIPTVSPIDTTPIDIDSVVPPKEIGVELKPSVIEDGIEQDDGKATFYTTYTYFTTFYAGNTSQIRSRLVTETNIVDNTKIDDNQLGRKVQSGASGNNLVQDKDGKVEIAPTVVKEEIKPTQSPDLSAGPSSVLLGTYIDNLYAEVKPADITTPKAEPEQKILFSQVAVISGDSTIVTNDNKTLSTEQTSTSTTTTTPKDSLLSPTPDVIESSVTEPETTTEFRQENEEGEGDSGNKKKSRLSFTTKKPSFTPVIRPFASRNRPTFSPKRVPLPSSATVITRSDFTPTITATPTLKSIRPSSFGSRKQSAFPGLSSAGGRRFSGRSSIASPSSNNIAPSRSVGFNRGSIQPSSRRQGFRSSSSRSSIDFANRSNIPRIRPTASIKLRGGRQSSIVQPEVEDSQVNESETSITQDEEHVTEALEEATEAPVRTTYNPLTRFRRPINRTPGTAVTRRTTTQITTRRTPVTLGRFTTTTRRTTTRTTNPLLSLRRQRPNALFPRRNLFKQPEPEPEEEIQNDEQEVNQGENDEILEEEDFDQDNDYDSSDRKEQHITTPTTPAPKRNSNVVQIRPFAFRRRTKRQTDYGNRKYTNFRRPGTKPPVRRSEPEPETEAPVTQKPRSSRYNSRTSARTTTGASVTRATPRQPFLIRGDSRSTTSAPTYRNRKLRPSGRTTTVSTRPKAPRLTGYNSQTERSRSSPQRTTSRSRARGSSTRSSIRQRTYNDNNSGERQNFNQLPNDGRFTITHHIPTEVTIPVVNGKITEYKNVLTAKPSIETVLANQVSTSLGSLGNQVLILASESTQMAENGVTKVIKFVLHESPTTTVIFTPTTIRGRKTSYSHVVPSTVYDVEYVTSTVAPELNANVPLANLLLSQLLLGNPQQQAINPLLALQGQGLIQPQPIVQTPVTEYKTRTTTYVTTVTDARETVLPITFKGKAILTTIVNPTTNVITATEFITDTVVTTPTVLAPQNNQFNSLLLPLLLQQQQQQSLNLQTQNPLLGLPQAELLVQNNLLNNDILNSPKPNILDITSNEDISDSITQNEEDIPPPPPPTRTKNKPRAPKPSPPKITSVVTLYVSGRIPGEFSTVLSTVVADDTQVVRKREAIYYDSVKLLPSILPSLEELTGSRVLENSVLAETEKYLDDKSIENQMETQSLESIVGELSRHIKYDASPTYVVKLSNPSAISDLTQSSIDDVS